MMPQGAPPPASLVPPASPTFTPEAPVTAAAETVSVQFPSPNAAAVDAALAAVRGVPGGSGAATVSLAIGGTSVMRVTVAGGVYRLAAARKTQGGKKTAERRGGK